MLKGTNAVSLLRLLRLAASKSGPEAEAASVLQKHYLNSTVQSSSSAGCILQKLYTTRSQAYWHPIGLRDYSKESGVKQPKSKASNPGKPKHAQAADIDSKASKLAGDGMQPEETAKGGRSTSKRQGASGVSRQSAEASKHPEDSGRPHKKARQAQQDLTEVQSASPAAIRSEDNGDQSTGIALPVKVPRIQRAYRKLRKEALISQEMGSQEATRQGFLQDTLYAFRVDPRIQDKALALYISSEAFPTLTEKFEDFIWAASKGAHRLVPWLKTLADEDRMKYLFELFAKFVVENHAEELTQYRDTINTLDLRQPHRWYPIARSLKRKFIYHAGPTNSGKTYTALQRMMQASSGVYCGPLRLLAMEVFDTCNAAGTFCNLVTGQEKRMIPAAEHTSCTIEMLDVANRVDVAVVDEVQLIGDDNRGWAWTKALLALPANEIHLCGDSSAVDLIQKMTTEIGEGFETREYQRFTPVQIESGRSYEGYGSIKQGDCVVAFSRKAIYDAKAMVEKYTGLKACLIYGALPPETRRQQAKLFNESDNDYDVLVASDAVGMGLNLNIQRIIFTTLVKNLGGKKKAISVSEIKQIAGRAGRRNSQYPVGFATCMNRAELPILEKAMATPMSEMLTPTAGLFPEFEHFEAFAGKSLISDFGELVKRFGQEARLDGTYFFCKQDSVTAIATLIQGLTNLTLKEKFTFCNSPVNTREPRHAACLLHFATCYTKKLPVHLEVIVPDAVPSTADELQHMEGLHQIVSLWLWLSSRFDWAAFPNRDEAVRMSNRLIAQMDLGLQRLTAQPDMPRPVQKLSAADIAKLMRRPFLRNLCEEARQHQEREEAIRAEANQRRMSAQIQGFRNSAAGKAQGRQRAAVAA